MQYKIEFIRSNFNKDKLFLLPLLAKFRIMKQIKIGLWVVFLFATATLTTGLKHAVEYRSLGDLVEEGLLSVKVQGNGGHSGKCIKMTLHNQGMENVAVQIEAGRRLSSDNPNEQDILITKSERVKVNGKDSTTLLVSGYCCQSSNSGPSKKSTFGIGNMAPSTWVTLAKFLDEHKFNSSSEQAAVWALSNDHPISSINSKSKWDVLPLRGLVAKIKNEPIPWYYVDYAKDTSVFSGKHSSLSGFIFYYVNANSVVNIVVKTDKDQLVKVISKGTGRGHGKQKDYIEIDVMHWKKGNYKVEVYQDMANLVASQSFKL